MAASTAKERFTAIWHHPIPAHLSIQEFSAKMEAQADFLLALPYDLLKSDCRWIQIIPNNKLDNYFKALGFPEQQRAEHCAQFLRDADAMKKISTAQEFAGASMFSVDVVTKIDAGSADGCDACIGIFKCPPHLSRTQFHEFAMGIPAAETVAVFMVQAQLLQVWTDDGLRQHFAGVDKAATNEYSNRFLRT
ncbi:hypothetical protein B0H14DRAFT_2694966, partial [Mycena olivaceomarginata]